ncbi:MAG: ABC transporter permease [Bdellovibrionaceae bacterium]|nr:ABC transporter permease [Pseudobdellovibrionaceae bacterium]NUM57053.1 ABC transporter permease subunit [Pseudobdellovibrionaceae bacterium]
MKSMFLISKATFLELVREKLFIVIIFISIFLILLSIGLGNLSLFEYQRILADLGLATIEISSLGLALFSGSYIIHKEIEKQTCLLLLAKPISRAQFLIGKFFGLVFLMLLNLVFLMLLLNLFFMNAEYFFNSVMILVNIFMKVTVVFSLVLFLSVIIRPVLSLLFGLSFYLYGHWINNVDYFVKMMKDPTITQYYKVLEFVSPQFYRMNWKSIYYLKQSIPVQEFIFMIGYFSLWIFLFLSLGVRKFNKKDIT